MSSEIINRQSFLSANANVGAIAIEQERAIAEAQGQLIIAKKFPRDLNAVHAELMMACAQNSLASVAFYSVPNRGSGPSIRLAEEVARCCGNMEWGHRELSRTETQSGVPGKSEIEVFAWDKQTNTRSIRQLTIVHQISTKQGPKVLTDSNDVDNLIANKASKQIRGRLLAIIPKWLSESAKDACRETLTGGSEPLIVRARKMVKNFSNLGVTLEMIENKIQHPLDQVTPDEIIEFVGIFNAIREGAKVKDHFEQKDESLTTGPSKLMDGVNAVIAANSEKPAETKPAETKPESKAATKAKSAPPVETKPEPKTEPKPEVKPEPKIEPKTQAAPEVETPAVVETEIKPTQEIKPTPEPEDDDLF